jgi:hypothetical protein
MKVKRFTLCLHDKDDGQEIICAIEAFDLYCYLKDTNCSDGHGAYWHVIISDEGLTGEQVNDICEEVV